MSVIDVTVPDIGNFTDVPIIEVLVRPGDTVAKETPLVTLESEKATMEVPSTAAGTVKDVKVKVGDKVSEGSAIVSVEVADAADAAPTPAPAAPEPAVAPAASASAPAAATPPVETGQPSAPIVRELIVPDIGSFTNVPVISVLVKTGDTIAVDAPLVELESEKATMEVPAAIPGLIRDVKVRVGDKVSQGDVLALVETTQAAAGLAAPPPVPAAAASAPAPAPAAAPGPARAAVAAQPEPAPGANGRAAAAPPASVHASPTIRRFARELGVELAQVRGSGPNGRITREDVQSYVKRQLVETPRGNGAAAPAGAAGGLNLLPWPKVDFAKFGPVERVPLTRIQKLSGPNLARNWAMIPHVTQHEDADVTELEAFRKQINTEQADAKVTMLALMMKGAVAALRRYPTFNSSLDGEELVLKRYYHLGFAADTPNGLLVPVIKDVDQKGVVEIARETAELAKKARDGKLGIAEMSGATFTISSLGGIGGSYFTPIINAPEVAILGASRTAMRPVWDGKAFVPRLMLPLSLSYDHRVIDGASAARFVTFLAGVLGDMRRTML